MPIKIFNYPFSKRQIILSAGDVIIVNGAIFLSAILRLGLSTGWDYIRDNLLSFLLTGLIFVFMFFLTELYDMRKDFKSVSNIITIISASTSAFIITTFLFYMSWSLRIGRGVFIILGILITFFIIGWRILYSYLLDQPIFNRNTLIIGAGWAGRSILEEINKSKKTGLKVIGFIDDDMLKRDTRIYTPPSPRSGPPA